MKIYSAMFVGMTLLSACGGGSDDGAGSLTDFNVTKAVGLNSGTSFCPSGKAGDIVVSGGTAPYTAYNPHNEFISFGPAGSTALPPQPGELTYTISNRNGQFAVFVNGCGKNDMKIQDSLGREAFVTVTGASGAGT